jgi:hypothetical protein
MKAEREGLDPAKRSILAKTSPDSVIDVFSFILPIYYARRIHASKVHLQRSVVVHWGLIQRLVGTSAELRRRHLLEAKAT